MLKYKTSGKDILAMLKEKGFTTTRIRKEKIISETAIQNLRDDKVVGIKSIEAICDMLRCQPNKIIEWVSDEK